MRHELQFGASLELEYYNSLTGERVASCHVRTPANSHARVREILESTQGSEWGPTMVPPCNIRAVSHLPQGSMYMLIVPAANPNTAPRDYEAHIARG
jgi:hypothetical protein